MKKLLPFLIFISLFCFQATKVSAQFADVIGGPIAYASWPTQLAQGAEQAIQAGITSMSALDLRVKAYFLDPAAKIVANSVLETAKSSTLNWVKSGFKGSPTFIVNPDVYVSNIATGIIRSEISNVAGSNNPFANNVIKSLVVDARNGQDPLNTLLPTLSSTIQNSVCNDANLTALANKQMNSAVSVGGSPLNIETIKSQLRTQLCSTNVTTSNTTGNTGGTAVAQQKKLNDCFANDFSCGGWDSWLNLTKPENTLTGQIIAANTAVAKTQNTKTENAKLTNTTGGGLAIKGPCLDAPNTQKQVDLSASNLGGVSGAGINNVNKPPCKNEEIQTPASTIESQLNKALTTGSDSLANAHGIGDTLSSLLTGALSDLMSGGVTNSGQRIPLDTFGASIVAGNSSNTPVNTTIPNSVNSAQMSTAQRDEFIKKIDVQININLTAVNNLKDIDNSYISTIDTAIWKLPSLSTCYDQAVASYTSLYSTSTPSIVNAKNFIFTKGLSYNTEKQHLVDELTSIDKTISGISDIRYALSNTTDATEMMAIYNNYQDKINSNYYISNSDYTTRKIEYLSDKRTIETELDSHFADCNQLKTNAANQSRNN